MSIILESLRKDITPAQYNALLEYIDEYAQVVYSEAYSEGYDCGYNDAIKE